MLARSTNSAFVHFGGDVIAHVESSHGARLGGGSTGGVVEAFGDDANVSMRVRGQGTGGVILGNSSQTVQIGNSTTGISVQRYAVEYTIPELAANGNVDSTYAVTGATTNACYLITDRLVVSTAYLVGNVRCSTANELTVRWQNNLASTIGTAASTGRWTVLQISF